MKLDGVDNNASKFNSQLYSTQEHLNLQPFYCHQLLYQAEFII